MHDRHVLPRRVLGDDCAECRSRAETIEGLAHLDPHNLAKLAWLAQQAKTDRPVDASDADMRAVDNLRLAARIVYASGISEETAR